MSSHTTPSSPIAPSPLQAKNQTGGPEHVDSTKDRRACLTPTPLFMECTDEPLSSVQQKFHACRVSAFLDQMAELEKRIRHGARMVSSNASQVLFRSGGATCSTQSSVPVELSAAPIATLTMASLHTAYTAAIGPSFAVPAQLPASNLHIISGSSTGQIVAKRAASAMTTPKASKATTKPRPNLLPRRIQCAPGGSAAALKVNVSSLCPQRSSVSRSRSSMKPSKAQSSLFLYPKPLNVPSNVSSLRSKLDSKVKGLLMLTPSKLTEWLIQQGLVPSQQSSVGPGRKKVSLKLGMSSDSKKFSRSGGYVWISDSGKFVSVFHNSIFEASHHSPQIVLKLLYHWVCQSNTASVMNWVKVNCSSLEVYYQLFRALCTATLHERVRDLGGPGQVVEVGMISLVARDSSPDKVQVDVLGVLEQSTGLIRLRISERVQAGGLDHILQMLPIWVQKISIIKLDACINKESLIRLGYTNLSQDTPDESNPLQVADYLTKWVKGLVQSALPPGRIHVTQQYLDELAFRENFGPDPLLCFNTIITRLSDLTSVSTDSQSLVTRLNVIAENPFSDWSQASYAQAWIDESGKKLTIEEKLAPCGRGRGSGNVVGVQCKSRKRSSNAVADLGAPGHTEAGHSTSCPPLQCQFCASHYSSNLDLVQHLCLRHLETEGQYLCKYCFHVFATEPDLERHLEEIHWKKGSLTVCRICCTDYQSKEQLLEHMTSTHVKWEMPYVCHICGFRSAIHHRVVDHFYQSHSKAGGLLCSHCLKIYSLSNGCNKSAISSFVYHVLAHLKHDVKCSKCCLSFHTVALCQTHLARDHVSVTRRQAMIPCGPDQNEETCLFFSDQEMPRWQATAKKLRKERPHVPKEANTRRPICCECGKKVLLLDHFSPLDLTCGQCCFITRCQTALIRHRMDHGGGRHRRRTRLLCQPHRRPIRNSMNLKCACGFTSADANTLATHMSTQHCPTAFVPFEEAVRIHEEATEREEKYAKRLLPWINVQDLNCRSSLEEEDEKQTKRQSTSGQSDYAECQENEPKWKEMEVERNSEKQDQEQKTPSDVDHVEIRKSPVPGQPLGFISPGTHPRELSPSLCLST